MGFKKEKTQTEIEQELVLKLEEEKANEDNIDGNKENEALDNEPQISEEEEDKILEEKSKELSKDDRYSYLINRIDKKKEEFNKASKKIKMMNYIMLGVMLVCIVGALIFLSLFKTDEDSNLTWLPYLVIGIAIVVAIIAYVFMRLQRKKVEKVGNEYISFVINQTNSVIYEEPKFLDLKVEAIADKKEAFFNSRIFKDIKGFKSINVINVAYEGYPLIAFDCAASVVQKNRQIPHFLGRMFVLPLINVPKEVRALFQLKGKNDYTSPVDDLEGLVEVTNNDKYVYYISDPKYKDVIDQKIISLIKRFRIDKTIYDVIISINGSSLYIGIDYEDSFISVPSDPKEGFNLKRIIKSKEDLDKVLDIFKAISSKKFMIN